MAELPPLRQRFEQLRQQLAHDCRCQQALAGSWDSDEACLFAVLRLAIDCRAGGDPATSLELLEWLRQQGVEHPLVVDNQIRGLIDADRFVEATLLLPALAELDQGEVLQGATDAVLMHQTTLLANVRRHCQAQQRDPVGLELLEAIPPAQLQGRLLAFAQLQHDAGGAALAMALLEELMHWGQWSLDAWPVELQQAWDQLVVQLGATVWHDLPSYRMALQRLEGAVDSKALWQRLVVELLQQQDLGQADAALRSALRFLMEHPDHDAVRAWLAAQQDAALQLGLPGGSADRVLAVDQALARDDLILDHLRKLVDPLDLSFSS